MNRKPITDAKWDALVKEAHTARERVPEEARLKLAGLMDGIGNLRDQYQIPPRVLASLLGVLIGFLSVTEMHGNVHDDEGFDQFAELGHAAVHVGIASARLSNGWDPNGKN